MANATTMSRPRASTHIYPRTHSNIQASCNLQGGVGSSRLVHAVQALVQVDGRLDRHDLTGPVHLLVPHCHFLYWGSASKQTHMSQTRRQANSSVTITKNHQRKMGARPNHFKRHFTCYAPTLMYPPYPTTKLSTVCDLTLTARENPKTQLGQLGKISRNINFDHTLCVRPHKKEQGTITKKNQSLGKVQRKP